MKKRILICDDDVDIREVTTLILKSHGYEVKIIENARNILADVEEFQPDLLLLDVMMPEEDGRMISRMLKNNIRTSELPVLLFTAVNNPESLVLESEADGVIAKPFDIANLILKIEAFLNSGNNHRLEVPQQSAL